MRTKTEIKQMITKLRVDRDSYKLIPMKNRRIFEQTINAQIKAMQYCLGYKIGQWYWCTRCSLSHKNVTCPKCGGSNLLSSEVKDD